MRATVTIRTLSWEELVEREGAERWRVIELKENGSGATVINRAYEAWRNVANGLFAHFKASCRDWPWDDVRDRVHYLRDRLLWGPNCDQEPDEDLLREWWGCIEALCHAYASAVKKSSQSRAATPLFPVEIALIIGNNAGYLAVGKIPKAIQRAAKKGRTGLVPGERRDIAYAVSYRLACRREGITVGPDHLRIGDTKPIKTLCGWFGVSRRTVQDWMERYGDGALGILGTGPMTAEILAHRTEAAGKRMRDAGRSELAVKSRQAKRAPK